MFCCRVHGRATGGTAPRQGYEPSFSIQSLSHSTTMPYYEYHCPSNGRTLEVRHSMDHQVTRWSELADLAGADAGSAPPDAPVERVLSRPMPTPSSSSAAPGCGAGCACAPN